MGDYFDDDDLMADAMEMDEPPPEEEEHRHQQYDEIIMLEQEIAIVQSEKKKEKSREENTENSQNLPMMTETANQRPLAALTLPLTTVAYDDDDHLQDKRDIAIPSTVVTGGRDSVTEDDSDLTTNHNPPIANIVTLPSIRRDPFAFERFSAVKSWRQTKKESNVSELKKWRSVSPSSTNVMASRWERAKSALLQQQGNRGKTRQLAPGAQMVELSHIDKLKPQNLSLTSHNNAGISIIPRVGEKTLPLTFRGGKRVHVRRNEEQSSIRAQTCDRPLGNMLGVSMDELVKRSDAIMARKSQNSLLVGLSTRALSHSDRQLWVDKHAPQNFSHLLSDERTNREVLRALRAWDPYVFRKDAPKKPAWMQDQNFSDAPPNANPNDKRPDVKNRVMLLSGPPGIGKTTLAHILALQCGYRPMEVNGSDDRSATTLKDRVIRSMDSMTLQLKNGSGGRPNCIILDEIDGADAKGAVAALVDIIKADIALKGEKQKTPYLRRPIIFICNHKYAPVLRPLLPYCRQFDVAPPSDQRLVGRLRSVLAEEGLSVFGGAQILHQLVTSAGGDIRSCLYTLQFVAARARQLNRGRDNTTIDISTSLRSVLHGRNGLKDIRNDLVSTITTVFRKPKQKLGEKKRKIQAFGKVLRAVEGFSDHSKTVDCLFTNIMGVSYVDPGLDRCFLAHEWLSATEMYRSMNSSSNSMELAAIQRLHMPTVAAAIHFLCRIETNSELTYTTREMTENRFQRESNLGLVSRFKEGLGPNSSVGDTTVAIETIPFSLWALSAGRGSGSLQRGVTTVEILTKHERKSFDAHVSTLRALGLTYIASEYVPPEKSFRRGEFDENQGGSSRPTKTMKLEPDIERLVNFKGYQYNPAHWRKKIPSVLRELLAHHAFLKGMKEREALASKLLAKESRKDRHQKKRPMNLATSQEEQQQPKEVSMVSKSSILRGPPTKKQKVKKYDPSKNFLGIGAQKAKAARTARKAAKVGFRRGSRVNKLSNTGTGIPLNEVVRFKYQKGFTQAVKTPCRMEDLM